MNDNTETNGTASSPNGITTAGPNLNTPPTPKPPSMKMIKSMDKQQKKLGKYIRSLKKNQIKANGKISRELKRLKSVIGLDDYNAIVAVATTFYPEKKDDAGKVTQEAYNQTNWQAVIAESKNLLVLRREMRMKEQTTPDGKLVPAKRKRTSGRSSDRKLHKMRYAFIVKRGKETLENKEEVAGTVKV